MERYEDYKDSVPKMFKFKIIVPDKETKDEMTKAMKYLHNLFDLDTDYIKAEDFKFEQGRLIQIEFEFGRTPIYEEVKIEEEEKAFKPKGKYVNEKTNSGRRYPQVTGYTDRLVCTGISDAKDDVYDLEPYLEIKDSEDAIPF